MIRTIDFTLALLGLIFTSPVLVIIIFLGFFDTGSPFFSQQRVGVNRKGFTLLKFRTMKKDTASVASHLASASDITRTGAILRKTKLDELPQLYNVLAGDMSLVGPRPNLFNQADVIKEREFRGVYDVRPGITGLAQIQNIDMSTPVLLAQTDAEMIRTMSLSTYFSYIIKTIVGNGSGDAVTK